MTRYWDGALTALRAWRAEVEASGEPLDRLPTDSDLATMAAVPKLDRHGIAALPLERPSAAVAYTPGILAALAKARTTPDVPPPASAPPAPPPAAPVAPAPPAGTGGSAVPPPPPRASGRFRSKREGAGPAAATPSGGTKAPAGESPRAGRVRPDPSATTGAVEGDGFATGPHAMSEPVPDLLLDPVVDDAGTLALSWPPAPDRGTVLYRVVTSDEFFPWSPEQGQLLVATAGTTAVDDRPFTGPVRHVQVWVHSGVDDAAARASAPRLLAAGTAVAPPFAVRVEEDHGTVTMSWQVAPGVQRVLALRVPEDQARQAGLLERYRLDTPDDARAGLVDFGAVAGQTYEYRLFAVHTAPDGAETISRPVVRRLRIGASLTPVRDLRATVRHDGGLRTVDLEWPQPSPSEVRIYRTTSPPVLGADEGDLDLSALAGTGLTPEAFVPRRPDWSEGRGSLRGIRWPDDQPRIHFTAVSVDGDAVRVGATATLIDAEPVEDAVLVQRVRWQMVTFAWPSGCDEVRMHTTPPGTPLPERPGPPTASLSFAEYEASGGLRLEQQLPVDGCDVHLVPVSYYGGEHATADPVTLRYRGLFRLTYRLTAGSTGGGVFGRRKAASRHLEVMGDRVVPPDGLFLTMVLVHRPDRFPLSPQDGTVLFGPRQVHAPARSGDGAWTDLGPLPELRGAGQGFVRLFATPPPGTTLTVAVWDPPVQDLRL